MRSVVADFIMIATSMIRRILYTLFLLQKTCTIIAQIVGREKQDIMMNQFIMINIGLNELIIYKIQGDRYG